MNAYAGDTLLYQDRVFRLDSQPLEHWFRLVGERPSLRRMAACTGVAPDYAATWTLDDDGWLRLTDLAGVWPDCNPLMLGHLFPLAGETIVAAWYSGRLHGVRLGDPHRLDARYGDLRIELQAGRLTGLDVQPGVATPVCDSPYWAASLV